MFNFLFRKRGADAEPVIETQRQSFERLITELNATIDLLPEKPAVTVDPATGHVTLTAPEQFPDAALALPEPEPAPEPEGAAAEVDTQTSDSASDEPTGDTQKSA